jgi:hypothetical protein
VTKKKDAIDMAVWLGERIAESNDAAWNAAIEAAAKVAESEDEYGVAISIRDLKREAK